MSYFVHDFRIVHMILLLFYNLVCYIFFYVDKHLIYINDFVSKLRTSVLVSVQERQKKMISTPTQFTDLMNIFLML